MDGRRTFENSNVRYNLEYFRYKRPNRERLSSKTLPLLDVETTNYTIGDRCARKLVNFIQITLTPDVIITKF